MIYQQSRERYFGNLVSERLRPGCGEWNRNRSIRRETTRRRPKTIVRPVFSARAAFYLSSHSHFPVGNGQVQVFEYGRLAVLLERAPHHHRGRRSRGHHDGLVDVRRPVGVRRGHDFIVSWARRRMRRDGRLRTFDVNTPEKTSRKKKKKNDRSRAKIKRNVLNAISTGARSGTYWLRRVGRLGRRRRLAPSFRYILRDDRRTWSQWTIPKENVLFAIFFFFFLIVVVVFFCRSEIRTHTHTRNFSYDSIAGIIRRNYSGNDNAIIFGAPSADVVGNSTPRHFTSPLLGRPSEQICFFVLTASNNNNTSTSFRINSTRCRRVELILRGHDWCLTVRCKQSF